MTRYRIWSLPVAFILLACAFAGEFYTGPSRNLVNPYAGDFFIVGWLYFLLSFVAPRLSPRWKWVIIFGFATAIELFQATGIPNSPSIPRWLVFWIGNTFAPWDLVCYAAGTLLAVVIDVPLRRRVLP
jgi:hypothetical protein